MERIKYNCLEKYKNKVDKITPSDHLLQCEYLIDIMNLCRVYNEQKFENTFKLKYSKSGV